MSYHRKKIDNKPQQIDSRNWFYDGKKYFTFVHEVCDKEGNYIQTDQFKVNIKQITDFICEMQ